MSQLALVYDAAHEGAVEWDRQLSWLRRAVDVLGHKEVAYTLDVKPSNLSDALADRDRKVVKPAWFCKVLRMGLPEEMIAEYLRIVCNGLGYETPKRIRTKTSAEELRIREAWLKQHAPAVLELMVKEIGE
jgi:hypothetical protein